MTLGQLRIWARSTTYAALQGTNLNTAKRTSSCAVTPSSAARSEPGFPTKAAWTIELDLGRWDSIQYTSILIPGRECSWDPGWCTQLGSRCSCSSRYRRGILVPAQQRSWCWCQQSRSLLFYWPTCYGTANETSAVSINVCQSCLLTSLLWYGEGEVWRIWVVKKYEKPSLSNPVMMMVIVVSWRWWSRSQRSYHGCSWWGIALLPMSWRTSECQSSLLFGQSGKNQLILL